MIKKYIVIFSFLTFTLEVKAMDDPRLTNPLANLNYTEVSNLAHIHIKHRSLLQHLGCDSNIFDANDDTQKSILPLQNVAQEKDNYEKECLAHLASIRRATILTPAYEALTMIALMGGATVGGAWYLGKDSYGGSIGIYSALYSSVFQLKGSITAFYHWLNQPYHQVDDREKKYVKNQCYIPRQLWPIIIEKLTIARQNFGEQRNALGFLDFTLGLTLYKQPSVIDIDQKEEVFICGIMEKIDEFFQGYQEFADDDQTVLKKNIRNFLQDLMGKPKHPHFLY